MSQKISNLAAPTLYAPSDEYERNTQGTTPSARETRAQMSAAMVRNALMNYGGYQLDGATDYLDGNALTGIADGKKGTFVALVRFGNASGTAEVVVSTTGAAFQVSRASNGGLNVVAENAAGTTILNQTLTGTPLSAAGSYAILISFDMAAGASSVKMYVNDVTNTITSTTFTDDTIDYTVAEWSIGASPAAASKMTGDFYLVWFDPTVALDFSDPAVRRKFFDANNLPVFLGRNGELPTGSAPIMFHGYDDYTRWPDQRGTASSTWTENGTPGAVGTAMNGMFAPLEEYSIPKTVTADYTVSRTDKTIVNNRAATNTLTLPAAASFKGRRLHILTIQAQAVNSASSNVVPITGGAAGTAILAAADGAWALLESDGSNWQIIAS